MDILDLITVVHSVITVGPKFIFQNLLQDYGRVRHCVNVGVNFYEMGTCRHAWLQTVVTVFPQKIISFQRCTSFTLLSIFLRVWLMHDTCKVEDTIFHLDSICRRVVFVRCNCSKEILGYKSQTKILMNFLCNSKWESVDRKK